MGFVDLHNHLLWALDDGCETPAQTLAAARLLVDLGFSDVAPSPHAAARFASGDPSRVELRRAEAAALLAREGIPLALHANAENRLDEEFLARVAGEGRRGIGAAGRWVLVEVPFHTAVPTLPDMVSRMRRMGVAPLFAHPERCVEFGQPGRAEEVVRLGGALQLNVGALVGVYGPGPQRLAESFVSAGLYAVGCSDLHRPEGAREWLGEALAALEGRAGTAALERLLAVNPRRILAGEDVV